MPGTNVLCQTHLSLRCSCILEEVVGLSNSEGFGATPKRVLGVLAKGHRDF